MSDLSAGDLKTGRADSFRPQPPLHVWLIREEPEDSRCVEELLRKSPPDIQLRREHDVADSLAALKARDAEEPPETIVLDLAVSESAGPDAVGRCVRAAPSTGIVVLADDENRDAAQTIQMSGTAEVLWKEALSPPLVGRALQWAEPCSGPPSDDGCRPHSASVNSKNAIGTSDTRPFSIRPISSPG